MFEYIGEKSCAIFNELNCVKMKVREYHYDIIPIPRSTLCFCKK